MEQEFTTGEAAYTEDCRCMPYYHDGAIRKTWSELSAAEKDTWNRNKTARKWNSRFTHCNTGDRA